MQLRHIFRTAALAMLTIVSLTAAARHLTGDEALQRVLAAWPTAAAHRAPAATTVTTHQLPGAYVFAQKGQGFVVAPADDTLPAILAYTDGGTYDEAQLPPAFHAWLSEIVKYGPAQVPTKAVGSNFEQLLDDIAWTQDTPMNDLCPRYNYGGYNYPTYAGCVAIALGQIMCYHQYPAQGKGHVAYTTDSYGLSVETDLDSHTYDWKQILPNYLYTNSTPAQRAEVAKLVFDIAAATQMDFTPGASNTQDFRAAQALVRHFGYDAALQLLDHRFYTTTEWAGVLRSEIDARRPVYLSGANVSGSDSHVSGHAFVVDGYRADGYFHINWGWDGSSNGFYLLTDLTPKDKQGIGGSAGGYAFMQNAIVGIQPDKGGTLAPASLCLIFDQVWTERDENGTSVNFFVANPTATDFNGLMALRITDKEGRAVNDPMDTALHLTCKAGYSGERGWYVDLTQISAGCIFELVYQRDGESTWHVAGARTGSPHSLVSYAAAGGRIALGDNAAELYDFRFTDLNADAPLYAGKKVTFTAKVKNLSDYEYFAPLYLMVYDADGETLAGYSDYQLCLVPARGEATVSFPYTLPDKTGSYHFCVAYETLGYNYAYSPMLRDTAQQVYDYVYNVNDDDEDDDNDIDGVYDYVLECVDYGSDAVRRDVKVRFEGAEVYIQGISEEVPDGWAHATIADGIATFETPLLLGEWDYYGTKRKQYITGADTNTGDVSGLQMLYDADSHSFTSFSNNWVLLTGDPTQVGYYYDHLYNSLSLIPASNAGDSPTVTPPDGLATSVYQLRGRHPYSGIPTDYTLHVGYSGDEVYVQGLYPAFPNAWIKGTITETKAEFTTPQYIGNYHGLYNMYIAGVDPDSETLCALTMSYDAAARTFTLDNGSWFIVQAGDADVMPMMLLDDVTIAPYVAVSLDYANLVLPAALEARVVDYKFAATDADDNSHVDLDCSVVIDGREVYVRGLSKHFPDVWVKGTMDGRLVVFPRNQHIGSMQGYDIWLGAGDTMSGEMLYGDFLLYYDADTRTFTQPDVNYLAINAATTKVYHLELYKGVTLSPVNTEGISPLVVDGAGSSPVTYYDLQGRRIGRNPGLYIGGGRKVLTH